VVIVPNEIVEATWREVGAYDSRRARRDMERVAERQPALLAFVMASTADSREEVKELAVYLYFVIQKMFDTVTDHGLQPVTVDEVERIADQREAALERLAPADERFLERAARIESEAQPHVLRYLTEAILEPDDPDLELSEDEQGLLFLVLSTVVELLDRACTASQE